MQTTTRATARGETQRPDAASSPWFRVVPEDGWLTVVLVAMLVYITVLSIQSVTPPWAPGLSILSTVTVVGLALAYLSVQQGRLPAALVHTVALLFGVAFAFAQTADQVLDGNRRALFTHTIQWFQHALLANGNSSDNTIFLLFLAILTLLLAYISLWLVVRTRRPWLAVLANGVVLLINLNWSTADHYIFLALFLLAALLLLVRFNLAENMRQWRARGLRFSSDLGWDFMQAGALFSVLVLLLAYNLPVGTANASIANALSSPQSPISALEFRLQELFGGLAGKNGPGGVAFFNGSLHLVGTVHLPTTQILHYSLPDNVADPTQYLITQTFDNYDGTGTWTQSLTQDTHYAAGQFQPAPSSFTSIDTYKITFDQVPQQGQVYLFAPGDVPASFSVPTDALVSTTSNVPTTWQAARPLGPGSHYTAKGYVSSATIKQLEKEPAVADLNPQDREAQYPDALVGEYLPVNNGYIAQDVVDLARQWTKGATNMYDAAVLIEDGLRTFTYSTTNPDPPAGRDAVSWFLQQRQGYCTFFASAMALMGRSLGMPTRIASGFTSGTYDSKQGAFIVRGTAAHTWTQIYFGQYGWVNFEPTQSFDKFARAIPLTNGPTPTVTTGPNASVTPSPQATRDKDPGLGDIGGNGHNSGGGALEKVGLGVTAAILFALLAIAVFLLWWRLLYRKLSPAAAALARVTRLGAWAGAPASMAQTPDEYVERLGTLVPGQRGSLTELSEVYDRERWGGVPAGGAPSALVALYTRIRGALLPLIAQRARQVPRALLRLRRRRHRRRAE